MASAPLGPRLGARVAALAEKQKKKEAASVEASDTTVFTWGKFKNMTFAEAWQQDIKWVKWTADHLTGIVTADQKLWLGYIERRVTEEEAADADKGGDGDGKTAQAPSTIEERVDEMESRISHLETLLREMVV